MQLARETKQAQDLIKRLDETAIGVEVDIKLGRLLSAFDEECSTILVEVQPHKYWELRTYWHGIHIATLVAEIKGTSLELEVV